MHGQRGVGLTPSTYSQKHERIVAAIHSTVKSEGQGFADKNYFSTMSFALQRSIRFLLCPHCFFSRFQCLFTAVCCVMCRQAESRAHRRNQRHCVNSYFIIARNTFEEQRWQTLSAQLERTSTLLDRKSVGETLNVETVNTFKDGNCLQTSSVVQVQTKTLVPYIFLCLTRKILV